MDDRGLIGRRGFWPLALLWLPAGLVATAAVRFGPEHGLPEAGGMVDAGAGDAADDGRIAGPGRALRVAACAGVWRRLWRIGYRRGAWWAGIALGAVTVAASLVAGLLGPVAIALYAAGLSLPVWIAWRWLARRG